ncbi:SpoIIE family protein phosphatase [Xylanibacillus composti]|nr:SpoIIE family protein phosphatase [Xylanibacillus composti]
MKHPFLHQGGDGYVIHEHSGHQLSIAVFDGLGHGERAVCAAEAFRDICMNAPSYEPHRLLAFAHPHMRRTAGAACMVVNLDRKKRTASYAGIGNISMFFGNQDQMKWRTGNSGILGYRQIHIREMSFPWEDGDVLILHTDGLRKEGMKHLLHHNRSPSELAKVICEHQYSGQDDALVLVCSVHAQRAVKVEEETIRA